MLHSYNRQRLRPVWHRIYRGPAELSLLKGKQTNWKWAFPGILRRVIKHGHSRTAWDQAHEIVYCRDPALPNLVLWDSVTTPANSCSYSCDMQIRGFQSNKKDSYLASLVDRLVQGLTDGAAAKGGFEDLVSPLFDRA